MKKLIVLIIAVVGMTNISQAQLEVTTNPIGLLFNTYTLSVDYNLNQDFSVGLDGIFMNTDFGTNSFYLNAKHYFFPTERGSNGIYIGAFGGQNSYEAFDYNGNDIQARTFTQVGAGFMAGYKITSRKNIVLDFALGLGKNFGNEESYINVMPYFKTNVGYRFNVKPKVIPKSLN